MDLIIENKAYGILFFNTNSFNILDIFTKDFKANYKFNDIEIVGSWKLFGIHDIMILVKIKKSDGNLTNFMRFCREFASKKVTFELPFFDETMSDFSNLYGNSYTKQMKIIEFWCDPLIPFKIESQELKDSTYPFLISFLRVDNFNVDKLLKINDLLTRNCSSEEFVGLFQGYGLYDLITIIKCKNYKDIQKKMNILRALEINDSFEKKKSVILDTASIITVSKSTERLTFSALLKIKPSMDKAEIWTEVKNCMEKFVEINNSEKPNCKLLISHRQGFFDIIITVFAYFNDYIQLLEILNGLPFVDDVATMLRYNVNEDY